MPSCAIDLRQRLFRCRHHEKNFVSETHNKIRKIVNETRKKRSQEYFVSETQGLAIKEASPFII